MTRDTALLQLDKLVIGSLMAPLSVAQRRKSKNNVINDESGKVRENLQRC